ncbi:MAG: GNAT family N-acetyltransferase [Gammaproteobacteria bacterium]
MPADGWQALTGADNPFASHAFHAALEDSGCVGTGTGWMPRHLTLEADGQLIGALPLFAKHDSFGEFVFDWAWADAWQQAGRNYYPKLVAAVPFSPVGAPTLLTHPGAEEIGIADSLIDAALARVADESLSSLHLLFIDDAIADRLAARNFILREDCQFHWHNDGFRDFDDFLARFRSAKRKEVRRERRQVAQSGLTLRRHPGSTVDHALWDALHALTARSFYLRGSTPYLNAAAFRALGTQLGDAMQAFVAWNGDEPVACALCVQSTDALYGRYWGACEEVPGLHFELCYYQGIEYCIERGLLRFEPGAQGEHKLARGFDPVRTRSAHWIADSALRAPVDDWCRRERDFTKRYLAAAARHRPYHRGDPA